MSKSDINFRSWIKINLSINLFFNQSINQSRISQSRINQSTNQSICSVHMSCGCQSLTSTSGPESKLIYQLIYFSINLSINQESVNLESINQPINQSVVFTCLVDVEIWHQLQVLKRQAGLKIGCTRLVVINKTTSSVYWYYWWKNIYTAMLCQKSKT